MSIYIVLHAVKYSQQICYVLYNWFRRRHINWVPLIRCKKMQKKLFVVRGGNQKFLTLLSMIWKQISACCSRSQYLAPASPISYLKLSHWCRQLVAFLLMVFLHNVIPTPLPVPIHLNGREHIRTGIGEESVLNSFVKKRNRSHLHIILQWVVLRSGSTFA